MSYTLARFPAGSAGPAPREHLARPAARLVLALAACASTLICSISPACPVEQPLVANIGVSSSASGPWSAVQSYTVSKNTTVFFHALTSGGSPMQSDVDWDVVGGAVEDTAHYRWDWNYEGAGDPDGNMGDASGLSASKSYSNPGNRVVRLYVYDTDGAGYTNDANKADTVTIKVKLTLETDWMANHDIYHSGLAEAWADAN